MKIGLVFLNCAQSIVDLIVYQNGLLRNICQRHTGTLAERHGPVAVKGTAGIHTDGQRIEMGVFIPTHAEKISYRALHAGLFLIVPVHPQNRVAPAACGGSAKCAQ